MRQHTLEQYKALKQAMAAAYGVENVSESFAVQIPMEITLNGAIQDSSEFLQRITILPKVDKVGQPARVNVNNTLASRTAVTDTKGRKPTKLGPPVGIEYRCEQTNFDVAFSYDDLDSWARFPNFMELYMQAVYRRIALDRILIGFHGTQAAATTDSSTNTLLQDVNKGWIQLLKDKHAENYLTEGKAGTGKIIIGSADTAHFKNLDQLVHSIGSMIGTASMTGNEVAIVGRGLVANDSGKALASFAQQPTEKANIMVLEKSYGGYPSMVVPGFPDKGVLVTDLTNLHIYYQEDRMRRHTENRPEYNSIVDFISSNEAYMVGDFDGMAALDDSKVEFAEA